LRRTTWTTPSSPIGAYRCRSIRDNIALVARDNIALNGKNADLDWGVEGARALLQLYSAPTAASTAAASQFAVAGESSVVSVALASASSESVSGSSSPLFAWDASAAARGAAGAVQHYYYAAGHRRQQRGPSWRHQIRLQPSHWPPRCFSLTRFVHPCLCVTRAAHHRPLATGGCRCGFRSGHRRASSLQLCYAQRVFRQHRCCHGCAALEAHPSALLLFRRIAGLFSPLPCVLLPVPRCSVSFPPPTSGARLPLPRQTACARRCCPRLCAPCGIRRRRARNWRWSRERRSREEERRWALAGFASDSDEEG